jgi:hypothetical protein
VPCAKHPAQMPMATCTYAGTGNTRMSCQQVNSLHVLMLIDTRHTHHKHPGLSPQQASANSQQRAASRQHPTRPQQPRPLYSTSHDTVLPDALLRLLPQCVSAGVPITSMCCHNFAKHPAHSALAAVLTTVGTQGHVPSAATVHGQPQLLQGTQGKSRHSSDNVPHDTALKQRAQQPKKLQGVPNTSPVA